MAAQLMSEGRGLFESGDQFAGEPDEIREAFEGYFAYFGRYEVNEAEQIVTHHVEGSMYPNWVDQDQTRGYEFSGSRLVLSNLPTGEDTDSISGTFVWEKAEK